MKLTAIYIQTSPHVKKHICSVLRRIILQNITDWTFNVQNLNATPLQRNPALGFMPPKVKPSHKCRNADQREGGGQGGEGKKHSPFPIPHKAPPIHMALFSALPKYSVTRWPCFILKRQITRSQRAVIRSGVGEVSVDSLACSAFSLQPETNLFGKLRAVQKETTHTVSRALNCWGQAGRHTHSLAYTHARSHKHTLLHKMAALTKISLCPESCLWT